MTRSTFQDGLEALIRTHHPAPPEALTLEIETGVSTMIEAAIRSASATGDDGLRPEVIYAIRASKLAARLLPAEVYRDADRRMEIKGAIRSLIRAHLVAPSPASPAGEAGA